MHRHPSPSFVFAAAIVLWGCGSTVRAFDDDDGTGGEGARGGQGGQGAGGIIGQPPPPPDDGPVGDGPGFSFAVTRLFLGATDRNGSPNPSAWRQYGYNLDGLVTTAGSPEHCQPAAGGKPTVMEDGDEGIDNAFGKVLMPLMLSLANDLSTQMDAAIAAGDMTWIFDAPTLGFGASYAGLLARAYQGAPLELAPSFDGNDVWPVTATSIIPPSTPRWPFGDSYVSANTLVLSPRGTFEMDLGSLIWRLPMQQVIISMSLDPERVVAGDGVIAGVIPVELLVEEVRRVAGSFSDELCSGTTIESLLDQIRQASDILDDGTQDPNRVCNAVSVGLGFEAARVIVGQVAPEVPPSVDPCGG